MTSNLVSMDISSEEVNNNNQEKAGCSGAIELAPVFNRKEATTGDTSASTVPAAAIVRLSGPSPAASVYSLNDTFRIKVTSAEEWLCVARMPRDFTQTELESLLDEFGPIHQCFLIHSEISGEDFFTFKKVAKLLGISALPPKHRHAIVRKRFEIFGDNI